MKKLFFSSFFLIILAFLPAIFSLIVWNQLPETIPTHWDIEGKADGFSSKLNGVLLFSILPLATWVIFQVLPYIDPKKENYVVFQSTFQKLKIGLVLIMSVIGLVGLWAAMHPESQSSTRIILIIVSFLFVLLGNYLTTVRPNYFIGFRLPWTLNDDENWKKTHEVGGKIWFWGGLLLVLRFIFLPIDKMEWLLFAAIIIMAIIPAIYSFWYYKQTKQP